MHAVISLQGCIYCVQETTATFSGKTAIIAPYRALKYDVNKPFSFLPILACGRLMI
jgi:hypothetical protein